MLCLEFRKAAVRTWDDLITAAAVSTRLAEESITDYLVLQLAKGQVFGNYQVQSFTKAEESINGADWELWLTGPSGTWFGLRIQAKVMKIGLNRFTQLHKPTPSAGALSATQRLINSAGSVGAVPLYMLYSAWTPTPKAPAWACGTYPPDDRLWGLSLVQASDVLTIKPKTTLKALAPHMQTAHCLFCCSAYGGTDLPTKAHSFAKVRFGDSDPVLLKEQPNHIRHLLSSQREATEAPYTDWPDSNLGRVTLIRQNASAPSDGG